MIVEIIIVAIVLALIWNACRPEEDEYDGIDVLYCECNNPELGACPWHDHK